LIPIPSISFLFGIKRRLVIMTATSANGLALMWEILYSISPLPPGCRL
jgi:hypothetical protein